ncbi:HNH endonuclease [Pumilibacter intestinalis]|uniref:HNH endonuclease n=1 Tax=Pumilibacter intestinalis TaxID=2941511 RepID=UPI00203E1D21|nr:HNH endonuclease [Pumilibacter intestinalis]
MKVKRIDAFEMNLEECSVARKFKLLRTTGVGEKRIYAGHDEKALDEFFDLNNIESFIMLKKDLQKYLIDAKDEYYYPVQEYKENISEYYESNVIATNLIPFDKIEIHFTKKYDSQHRYYLNFGRDNFSSNNWDYLRNIALPRVTKLNFVKVKNICNNKLYIYIKPMFFIDEKEREEKIIIENLIAGNKSTVENRRKGQLRWRRKLLDLMPACVITRVTEDRILEACHIKPHNASTNDETYDVHNGLIMTPTYHRLFDYGFISFKDNGALLVSPFLSNMNKQRLNLVDGNQCRIPKECSIYLKYHRENIYNQIPDLQL